MRAPRRSFAAPFVLVAAIPACRVSSSPPPRHVNPPPPSGGYVEPAPQPDQPPTGPDQVTVANPPRPTGPTGPGTAPTTGVDGGAPNTGTAPASTSKVWFVTKQGATCTATLRVSCPTAAPGQPTPTCNPPPPMKYDCPTGWDGTSQIFVTQYAGATECVIEAPATNCAPNEKCRKPAPQKVPCPKY